MAFTDFFGGGSTAGSKINKQSKASQQLISHGMDQLDAIFKGGSYGVNPMSSFDAPGYLSGGERYQFDPNDPEFQKWYAKKKAQQGGFSLGGAGVGGALGGALGNFGGSALGMLGPYGAAAGALIGSTQGKQQGGKGKDGINEKRWASKYGEHLAKTGQLYGGTQTEKGFGPDFYKQASDAYLNYNMPQLVGQFNDARKSLDYSLANKGIMGGSAAEQQVGKLNREGVIQRQALANNAIGVGQNLEKAVNNEYATLAGQLQQGIDPSRVTQQALGAAAQFSQPSALQPLGSLFSNYANQYLAGKQGEQYGKLAGNVAGYNAPINMGNSVTFTR